MPDFAPDYTARFRVRYHAGGRDHSQTWRFTGPGTDPTEIDAVRTQIQDFYVQIGSFMFDDWSVLSTEYAPLGSSIFLPGPGLGTGTAIGTFDPTDRGATSQSISFVGRTTGGLRAVIFQYGSVLKPGATIDPEANDFRVTSLERSDVAGAIGQLNISSLLRGNDGNPIVWYPYINLKFNDYWLGKVRRGA